MPSCLLCSLLYLGLMISTVFKDMIGLPGSSSLDPIPLDHPALTIQNFLNITTTMSGDMLLPAMSFKSAFAFLEFSHQFGCDQWLPKAKGAIFRAADRDPIAIFDFAADNDDWARGQGAVSHLGSGPMRSTFKESGACFEQWLEQKPIEWQLALLRAIVYNTPYLRFNTSWGYAGQSFVRPAEFKKRK